MKKFIAVLLSILMIISLSACGEKQKTENQKAEKYCFNCGEEISKKATFCEYCGALVKNNGNESETNTSSEQNSSTGSTSNSPSGSTSSKNDNSNQSSSSEDTLIVAVEADFYPFSYKENGEFVGIHIDMAKEMANRLNLKVEFVPAYFEQLIDGVDKGHYDIAFGLEKTPQREEIVMFTDSYYDGMCIIFRGDTFTEYSNITVTLKNMINDGTVENIFAKYNIVL